MKTRPTANQSKRWMSLGVGLGLALALLVFCYFAFVMANEQESPTAAIADEESAPVYGLLDVTSTPAPAAAAEQPATEREVVAAMDTAVEAEASEVVATPVTTPEPALAVNILSQDTDNLPFVPDAVLEQARNQVQTTAEGVPFVEQMAHRAEFADGSLAFTALPETATGSEPGDEEAIPDLAVSLAIEVQSASITIGTTTLADYQTTPSAAVEGNIVRYERGQGVVEEFIARNAGIEQRWWLEEKPSARGDLTIVVEVLTALDLETDSDGFVFQALDKATGEMIPAIRYARPLAIDADQQTLWAQTDSQLLETTEDGLNHYHLIFTFPADWLEHAQYPLLVDPLVSGLLRLEQGSPAQNQQNIQIAYNPDNNEFLLVWQDYRNGNNWDIYAQRLDGDGALLGDNFVINSSAYHQDVPHVMYAPGQDRYLVAWRHYTSASQYDVYGQRLSGTGDFVGSAFAIATGPASTLQTPTDIVYNSQSNQFLVLWQDGRSGKLHVFGRHVSLTGSLGSETQITSVTSTNQKSGVGAYNAANDQYLVVWATTDSKILARRMTGGGVVTTTDTILLSSNTSIDTPDVVYLDGTVQYLVVWKDNRNSNATGSDIYGRLVTPAGSTNGSEYVISNHSASETVPRLTLSASGGAWVVWQRDNGATTGQDLYAQELNSSGQPIGSLLTIYETGIGLNQERPVVAGNALGDLVFAWQDNRKYNWDIYARLRLANGDMGGDFLTHPASGSQENIHIAFNTTASEYLVVWQDFRNDLVGWQVYGQRVSSSGALVGDNIVINSAGIEPVVAYSSVSNEYLVVWTYNNTIQGQRINAATGALSGSAYLVIPGLQKGSLADQPSVVYNPTTNLFLVAVRVRVPGASTIHKIITRQTPGLYSNVELVSQTNIAVAEPDVAVADDGSYLVAWQDARNSTHDIYGRRLTSAGTLNGSDFLIGNLYGDDASPDVAWNSTASAFLVVWENYAVGISNFTSAIAGQQVNTSGALVGSSLVLDSTDSNNEDAGYVTNPSVAASNGKWLVVWQDARDESTLADIKARTIRDDGVLLAGQTIPLMVTAGEQKNPVIVGDNLDYALLAWQDNREGSWDLYAALHQMDISVSGLAAANNSPTTFGNTTSFNATITAGTNVFYSWNFGDNTSGYGAAPNHTYAQPGTYTATVTATNSDNLLTASTLVVVYQPAVADFSGAPVAGSIPLTVTFSNSSQFATSYLWHFGDGTTSTTVSPSHVYTQPGQYTVSLTATGPYNTSVLTRSAYIMATDIPVTGLTVSNSSPTLLGNSTFFTATVAAGTNVSYTWDFGDTATGTGATPNHTYAQSGTYTATVTATNSVNALMATTVVAIYQPAAADFVGTPVSGTVPLSVTFSNNSTFTTSYLWQFGDGSTSTTISPTHVYTQTGIYTVTLWATNPYSSDVLTRSAYITVLDNNPSVVIVKEGPAIVEAGEPITYTLTVTNNGQYNLSNIVITDTLPSGANYVGGGTLIGQTVRWTFPSLTVGNSLSVSFVITANSVVINDRYAVTANGGLYATGEPVITVIGEPWGGYWWDDTFFYRRPLTLTTGNVITSGPGITNTVAFTITTSTLISDGKLQLDGDDLRVLYRDILGWHVLPSQISSVVSPTAVITFPLASPLPDTEGTYWLYYGNAIAGPGPELAALDVTAGQVITSVSGTGTITPTVTFFADPRLAWVGQSISFTNYVTPVAVIDTFTWNFGDAITSTISNTSHIYTTPGVYTITLTVTTTEGLAVTYGYTNYITILDDQNSVVTITVGSEEEPVVITALTAGQPGKAHSAMGDFFVAFPSGAITQTLIITHTPFQAEVQQNAGVMKRFALDAATTAGQEVTQFGQPLQLLLDLTAWNMTPAEMATVVFFYWDETEAEWLPLPTVVDTAHGVALATTDHFSDFAASSNYGLGGAPSLRRLPSVSEGGVDLLTGSSTYVYPLEVPPGTHGMQPNLSLVYNSGAADTLLDQQAGIVGHGFELAGLGWIQVDPHDSDTYYLNLNGISEKLIHETGTSFYRTEHDTFWQIELRSGGDNNIANGSYWLVTVQDGTQFRFGFKAESTSYLPYIEEIGGAYRFDLDQVQDVYGNTITIFYEKNEICEQYPSYPEDYTVCADTSIWPDHIAYTSNDAFSLAPREIGFVYGQPDSNVTNPEGYRADYIAPLTPYDSGPNSESGYPIGLLRIVMSVNGSLARTYEFSYAYFTQNGEPTSWYGPDRYHLMLTNITEKGVDSSPLPSTVFTYTQTGHLYRIENGYGGRITYNYQKIEDWTQNFYHFEQYETCLLSIFCKNRQPDTDRWRVTSRIIEDVTSGQNDVFYYFYEGTLFQGYSFRGHQKVTILDPEGLATTTYFSLGEYNAYSSAIPYAYAILWGKPYEVIAREGSVYRMLHRYYTYDISFGIPGVADRIISQCNETYMESNTPLASCVYFDQYGNIERTVEKDINEYGEDRETIITYEAPPASYYITNRPRAITVTVGGNMVGLTIFDYEVANTQSYPVSQLMETRVDLGYGDSVTNYTQFDGVGNVAAVYQGLTAPPTTFVYDSVYQTFLAETNFPLGLQERYEFDARFGAVTAITDVNGLTMRYSYDPFGRVLSETGGSSGPVAYTYVDSSSGMDIIVKHLGSSQPDDDHYTYLFYNGLGQLVRELRPDGSGTLNVNTRYGYDGLGRLITTTIPYTGSTPIRTLYTTYDPLGRPVTVESLDGITQYSYPDWSKTIVEDASGAQKLYEVDALGRVIRVIERDDLGNPLTTTYGYLDNSVSVLTIRDAQDNPTYIYFDSLGRKRGIDDPDMGYWEYTYNDLGQLETQTDARGVVTTLLYDDLGRVTDKSYTIPGQSGVAATAPVVYGYTDGFLTSMQDGSGETTWEHDTAGRVLTETKTIEGQIFVTAYQYDAFGRLLTMTYPDGEVVTYTYNVAGQVTQMAGDDVYLADAQYTSLGQPTLWALGNGVNQTIQYDTNDDFFSFQPKEIDAVNGSGQKLQDLTLFYDRLGRLDWWQDNDLQNPYWLNQYYDDLSRIDFTDSSNPAFVQDFGYDLIGNLITRTGHINQVFNQGSFNRPHLPESDANGTTYTYDANGNLSRREILGGRVISYTYDAENRLVQVISRTGTVPNMSIITTTVVYDGHNQRALQNKPNGDKILYFGTYMEAEVNDKTFIQVSNSIERLETSCFRNSYDQGPYFVWNERNEDEGAGFWFYGLNDPLLNSPIKIWNDESNSLLEKASMAIDSTGNVHIILESSDDSGSPLHYYYWYVRLTIENGKWVSETLRLYEVGSPHADQSYIDIVVDNLDEVHLIWTFNSEGRSRILHRSITHQNQSWIWDPPIIEAPRLLLSGAEHIIGPSMATKAGINDNDFYLTWVESSPIDGSEIFVGRFDDGRILDTSQLANSTTIHYSSPSLAFDGNGRAHIAWAWNSGAESGVQYRYSNTVPPNSPWSWSSSEEITNGLGPSKYYYGDTHLIARNDGEVHVAWPRSITWVYTHRTSNGTGWDWSLPEVATSFNGEEVGVLGRPTSCAIAYAADDEAYLAFVGDVNGVRNVYYTPLLPQFDRVVKRYFAQGQQVATRVDGELFYHLNDPSGRSLTLTDAEGETAWQVVYDGYGAVLTGTVPITLTQTLLDMPDGTTGLVHQGNGRYYDPALGRPLQPNPAGVPPTVPQALNRYAATALGQPGVFQAVSQSSLTNLSLAMGAIKSSSAEILARATWGDLGQTVRILRPPSKSVIHVTASNSFLKKASHIIQEQWTVTAHSGLGSADRKLYTATFDVALGATTEDGVLAVFRANKLALPSGRWAIKVSITNGDEVYDTVRTARLGWINNTRLGLATDVLLSATFQWIEDSYNPHFTIGQRIGRTTIAGAGSLGSSLVGLGAGSLACGPAAGVCFTGVVVTVSTTFAVNAFWSYVLQPLIFQNVEGLQPPPRDLHPLSVN